MSASSWLNYLSKAWAMVPLLPLLVSPYRASGNDDCFVRFILKHLKRMEGTLPIGCASIRVTFYRMASLGTT